MHRDRHLPHCPPGGFVSGGGVGHQTRKFGTASDRPVSARVVLADGRPVRWRLAATEHRYLYWALRGGGGGNFCIVLDFELLPLRDQPCGVLCQTAWPWDRAAEVV